MLFVNLTLDNYDQPYALRKFLTPEFRADIQKALGCRNLWHYYCTFFFDYYRYDHCHPDLQSLLCQIPIFFVTTDQAGEREYPVSGQGDGGNHPRPSDALRRDDP